MRKLAWYSGAFCVIKIFFYRLNDVKSDQETSQRLERENDRHEKHSATAASSERACMSQYADAWSHRRKRAIKTQQPEEGLYGCRKFQKERGEGGGGRLMVMNF